MSTLDADGCGWICLSPGCPELAAGELEAADLVEAGVPEALAVSYHSDDFAEAQEAKLALTAVGALCTVLRRTAGDALDRLAGVDSEMPGLLAVDER